LTISTDSTIKPFIVCDIVILRREGIGYDCGTLNVTSAERNSEDVPAKRTVIAPTPNKAQKTNIERPMAVSGAKSPYPMVVNAIKPIFMFVP
jgi:hypothetical protein